MTKRLVSEALLGEPTKTPSKRIRIDQDPNSATNPSTANPWPSIPPLQAAPKRPAPEDAEADSSGISARASRKDRTGESPKGEEPLRARSPSPWPDIEDSFQHEVDPVDIVRQEHSQQQIRTAINRAETHFRGLQQEYTKFRQSRDRLPSPVLSDKGSEISDSEADDNGCTPMMFGMENDDPRVEEVFGIEYARRLEERRRDRASTRHLPPHRDRITCPPPARNPPFSQNGHAQPYRYHSRGTR